MTVRKPPGSPSHKLQTPESRPSESRREFLKSTSAAAVGATLAANLLIPKFAHGDGDGSATLKVGLIGCGGRGSGAAVNAINADGNCRLVALADAFEDRLQEHRQQLAKRGEKLTVTDDMCFVGFDAYQQLLATDVDMVILATPPHFRPEHFRACVEAGKHTFVEKPVAVDAPGIHSVLESTEIARQKNLSVVSGLCWRYDYGVRETMKRIEDGAIGDIVAIQSDYPAGSLWYRGNDPSWSPMEYQMRNWYYYTWLSGDHNVEQYIHGLDKIAWLMGDKMPLRAYGMGGRQQRTEAKYGHIFDHHAVVYEFDKGVRAFSYTRQQAGCSSGLNGVDEYVMGTKGQALIVKHQIKGENPWRYRDSKPSMYDVEHQELLASIRSGKAINDGVRMANSTMIGIMGRMCTYTGQTLTWDQCFNSSERLGPETYAWGDMPEPEVAIPGITPFA